MENKKSEIKYLLALAKNPKINSQGLTKILDLDIPLKDIFSLKKSSINRLKLPEKLRFELSFSVQNHRPDQVLEELEKLGISYITTFDDAYPPLLREIFTPPTILYYRGVLPSEIHVGVVGSRKPTDYGRAITRDISSCLAQSGIVVTSGLALGIDSIAHEAALAAKGKTVAVLGCGLDQIYPSTHESLAKNIVTSGAIISEYPVGVPPLKQNFPARNRIISGLSVGLVVTEASEGSGSLITARDALEQNREVFAVPGSVYNKNSFGPNSLIKLGAKLITSSSDIFEELGIKNESVSLTLLPRSSEEAQIFEILAPGPLHIDEIIKKGNKDHGETSSLLTLMEISGKIKHLGGMVYRLNK